MFSGPTGRSFRERTDSDAYSYEAYGGQRTRSGLTQQPLTFTGEHEDLETGLFYLRARYYDPEVGRFLGKDALPGSVLHIQTWNAYAYVSNNPLNLVDPSGFRGMSPRFTVGLFIGAGAVGGISGSFGPEIEFATWNPIDWQIGLGGSFSQTAKLGPEVSGGPKAGASLYVWDKNPEIDTVAPSPHTVCAGGSAGFGIGGSLGACSGGEKTGGKASICFGAQAGVSGYTSVSTDWSTDFTFSLRELWEALVINFNYDFGRARAGFNQLRSNREPNSYEK